ncbi:MAG: hypothetical protein PW843_24340 [Azospirillaceae bacterium]|nr:hypothetical protein [Azospirillaceae bacterium]
MKVNVNQAVLFQLTDHGHALLRQYCDQVAARIATMTTGRTDQAAVSAEQLAMYLGNTDEFGRMRMTLWHFMSVFGPAFILGNPPPVVACALEVVPDDGLEAAAADEAAELKATFDLRWKADMRAIARWQAATGKTLTWPDHADLCVWLMEQLDATAHVEKA